MFYTRITSAKKNIRSQHIEHGFYTLKVLHNKIIMEKTKTTKM